MNWIFFNVKDELQWNNFKGKIKENQRKSNPTRLAMTRMQKKQPADAPLTEIEKVRARTMMRNNRIFQSLGIGAIAAMMRRSNDRPEVSTITSDAASAITQGEGSDYNPGDDQVTDGEEVEDNVVQKNVKNSRKKKCAVKKKSAGKKTSRLSKSPETTTTMGASRVFAVPPGGSKRLLEVDEPAPTRFTRSKLANVSRDEESNTSVQLSPVATRDSNLQLQLSPVDMHLQRSPAADGARNMQLQLSPVADGATNRQLQLSPVVTRARSQPAFPEHTDQPVHDDLDADDVEIVSVAKNKRKGTGLERMTKSLGTKMIIHIAEGMKRPENPLQAAKLATEGGLIARSFAPVLPHFKEYKKDGNVIKNYIGKVAGNFEMDTGSADVRAACTDMLQKRTKNMRHKIKKEFFDNVPAHLVSIKSPVDGLPDDEWTALLKLWSTPRHKKICLSNKDNRAKVQFPQKTGSRSYAAHIYAIKEERKGQELSVVDILKVTHNSKKDGYSEPAKVAIAEMEKLMDAPVPEGEEPKSATEVVAQVLPKSSSFLVNAGLQSSSSRNKVTKSDPAVIAQVIDLQGQLERSQQQGEAMREELSELKKKSEETEAASAAREAATAAREAICDKEFEQLRKKAEETNVKFARLMAMMTGK